MQQDKIKGFNVPYDIEAEKVILASMLLDSEVFLSVYDVVKPDDFYDPVLRSIYEVIVKLHNEAKPIDVLSVKSYIKKRKGLRKILKTNFFEELVSFLPLSLNVEFYASVVKDCSTRRRLISLSNEILREALDESVELSDVLNDVEKKIFHISDNSISKKFIHIRDLIIEISKKFEGGKDRELFTGFSTGFKSVDNIIGGLHKGDLIIIAARPSVGKTAFMLEIVRNVAVKLKKRALIFSLEMSREQVADRLLSLQSEIPLVDIRMGNLDKNHWDRLYESMDILHKAEIFIDDFPGQNILEIRTKARKWHLDIGLDVIFVDYLQLLQGKNKDNRVQEVSEISQGLKNIARELGIPVVALSQLNRSVESRNNRRPQLSDLRESGSIEQDADIVIFLHRESYYNHDIDESEKYKTEAIVSKNRNGATGIANLKFIDYCAKFIDLESD